MDLEADDEEPDESWLSRRSAPGEVERRAEEERWDLILDLEDDLRSAEPDYADELIERLRGGTADPEGILAVRRLLEYRRTEATRRERAIIEAMIAEHQSAGRWNVSEAWEDHYEPPSAEDDVVRRQFAQNWSQIKESIATA